MKKMLALLLAAVMVLSMAACAAAPPRHPRLPQRKRPLQSPKI